MYRVRDSLGVFDPCSPALKIISFNYTLLQTLLLRTRRRHDTKCMRALFFLSLQAKWRVIEYGTDFITRNYHHAKYHPT